MKKLSVTELRERSARLSEIKEEIRELADEALALTAGTEEHAAAKSYWYAHIICSLDDDHGFLGKEENIQDSIESLTNRADEIEEGE